MPFRVAFLNDTKVSFTILGPGCCNTKTTVKGPFTRGDFRLRICVLTMRFLKRFLASQIYKICKIKFQKCPTEIATFFSKSDCEIASGNAS